MPRAILVTISTRPIQFLEAIRHLEENGPEQGRGAHGLTTPPVFVRAVVRRQIFRFPKRPPRRRLGKGEHGFDPSLGSPSTSLRVFDSTMACSERRPIGRSRRAFDVRTTFAQGTAIRSADRSRMAKSRPFCHACYRVSCTSHELSQVQIGGMDCSAVGSFQEICWPGLSIVTVIEQSASRPICRGQADVSATRTHCIEV